MSQPQILLCVPTGAGDEDTVERLVATLVPPLVATGLATFDTVQKGTWGKDFATVLPTSPFSEAILATARSIGHIPVLQIALDVSDEAVAEAESPGYTVPAPAPAEDKLREYYLRHAASSAYVGASSINARLVTLELPDGVQVEVQPEPEAAEETDAAEPAQPTP